MSDDEGGGDDDYGEEYDDFVVDEVDEIESDDETEDEDAEAEADDADEAAEIAVKVEKQRIDPILRISNKSRNVIIVPPDERVTDNRLQKSEAAHIISMRAQEIAQYGTSFTDIGNLHDPVDIAIKELQDRKCPMLVRRSVQILPNGDQIVEEWDPKEMALPMLQ